MSILGSDPAGDFEQQALAEIRAAGRNDWHAAAWRLERDPQTRSRYSDHARTEAIVHRAMEQVLKAIAATALPPDWERILLLQLQAHALPVWEAEP